ncbi:MAG: cyclase family protein [Solirubrobacterales bacterium]
MCGDDAVFQALAGKIAAREAEFRKVTTSPFGPDDEIGMLNLLDSLSPAALLARASGPVFDLAVDYFIGMPSWNAFGDPPFQIWMSHTPQGSVIDDVVGVGDVENDLVSYSSDCVSMYTHTGTHVDALNHFGYDHAIWNGFREADHLGSRRWTKGGAEKHPPIITRGVLLDVAAAQGVEMLPPRFVIGPAELDETARRQGVEVRPGDVVLIRTGRMLAWPDSDAFILDEPGLDRAGAEHLCKAGATMIGADNIALEVRPSGDPENFHVVHSYMLAEAGVPILEMVELEELAAASLHEFAFIGACLKIRGATGSPMRPIAIGLG